MILNEQITIIIKTLMRERALKRLLASISKTSLVNCHIVIADDSKENIEGILKNKFPHLKLTYLHLPFDSGASKGRNMALEKVNTPYFLLCDDDYILDKKTDFKDLINNMEKRNLDIMGGAIIKYPIVDRTKDKREFLSICRHYYYRLFKKGQPLNYLGYINIYDNYWEITYYKERFDEVESDIVLNFFIGKTAAVKSMGGWNDKLKTSDEHSEFFVRFKKAGFKVGFTNNLIAKHFPERFPSYTNFRFRRFGKLLLEEHHIEKVVSYYPERKRNQKETLYVNERGELIHQRETI